MNDSLKASYAFCQQLSRREARNFYYSFLLLPAPLRLSMCALYAFMRRTDDIADEPGDSRTKALALDAWRADLERAVAGGPDVWPGLPALADTVHQHQIPLDHLHAVIDGVQMDLEPRGFSTFDELHGYCYRVASAVGLCCIRIWGYHSHGGKAEALAEDCGIALQLTNILRDVREDAARGRVYLPREDLTRFGVTAEELASGIPNPRIRQLLEYQGSRAYDYFSRAQPLVHLIAPVGRPVLGAMVGIYKALLDEIDRREYDVLGGRISLPAWKKSMITLEAMVSQWPHRWLPGRWGG